MKQLTIIFLILGLSITVWAEPRQTAVQANGMLVRVVGAEVAKDAKVVKDTELGDMVIVEKVPDHALCNIVVFAKQDTTKPNARLPYIPELDFADGVKGVRLMPGTCRQEVCVWNLLLAGQECIKVAYLKYHYVGSTLKEMWDLPSVRKRLLVTEGACKGMGDKTVTCTVPVGDKRAVKGKKVRFNHSWAGRADLSFQQKEK